MWGCSTDEIEMHTESTQGTAVHKASAVMLHVSASAVNTGRRHNRIPHYGENFVCPIGISKTVSRGIYRTSNLHPPIETRPGKGSRGFRRLIIYPRGVILAAFKFSFEAKFLDPTEGAD